jgi:hypothetical protein
MQLNAFIAVSIAVGVVALLAIVGRTLGAWSRAALLEERARAVENIDRRPRVTAPLLAVSSPETGVR